ncbi:copper resistance protein CopC [Micromonospora sp. PLK6-60]|uniref:copper resistance CopC family protein n=1 Tax=Micromonospora sp. PLK6-60 TaxID=2873383 RepID=UPI0027E17B0C|nr:copper resistance protein CopC [Micromonospora sp. PLK6-60]
MALGVSLMFPAAPAAAHNSFTGSTPAKGARVTTAPAQVELRFLAKVNADNTTITVTGPGDAPAAGGPPRFAGSRVLVPLAAGPAGEYVVAYRVGSADGHPIKGEVRFTVTRGTTPAATPQLAPSSPAAPSAPATTGPATPATGAAPSSADPVATGASTGDGSRWRWPLVAVAVLAVLAAAVFVRRRRAR